MNPEPDAVDPISTENPISSPNPILNFVHAQGVMVLDGGLATTLEAMGCDLNDELWSAKILLEAPDSIRRVHQDFLEAGADCITSASYQASLSGFRKRGLSDASGEAVIRLSVQLAIDARNAFWHDPANRPGRLRPLVAASVGPYGAFMADGSEYTGDYPVSDSDLYDFHRRRWEILCAAQADLLACETIPTEREARVLLRLLRETPEHWAWFSFSCRDGKHLSDGGRLLDAVRSCDAEPRVAGIGINCTAPRFIADLIDEVRKETEKPILVYPNSGERYDAVTKAWASSPESGAFLAGVEEWVRRGAVAVGGCCRVGPGTILQLRKRLVPPAVPGQQNPIQPKTPRTQ